MSFMRATATADETEKFHLVPGDVLLTKDSEVWDDIVVPVFLESSSHDLVCGYHLAIPRPHWKITDGTFRHRALSSEGVANQLAVRANGVTRFGLSQAAIKDCLLPLPPGQRRSNIVCFVDEVMADADQAIDRKHREIELLREYRTRLIVDVVTGKLDVRDAAAELTDSIPNTVRDGNETSLAESNPILRDNSLEKETRP